MIKETINLNPENTYIICQIYVLYIAPRYTLTFLVGEKYIYHHFITTNSTHWPPTRSKNQILPNFSGKRVHPGSNDFSALNILLRT